MYPSGLRGEIANLVFAGSNPVARFNTHFMEMERQMKAGELKKSLENVDDDVLIVKPSPDHNYVNVDFCGTATAITDKHRPSSMTDDHFSGLAEGETRIGVFVIN